MSEKQTHIPNRLTRKEKLTRRLIPTVAGLSLLGAGVSQPEKVAAAGDHMREVVSDAWNEEAPKSHKITVESPHGIQGETIVVRVGGQESEPKTEIGTAIMAVEVEKGDTAWGIAEKYFPDKDPREVVYEQIYPQLSEDHILHPGDVLEFEQK